MNDELTICCSCGTAFGCRLSSASRLGWNGAVERAKKVGWRRSFGMAASSWTCPTCLDEDRERGLGQEPPE